MLHYIAGMAKKNKTTTAAQISGSKEYEKHVCGECKRCTPVTKFNTLTVKDRKPTLG
jgi:heterodisulfide reductase subunit A-like polyferredoxin